MRCQTSPSFSFLKYGKADKYVDLDFSGDIGLLYHLSSTLLFWETDADACLAVDLVPSRSEPWDRRGSLSLLWPLFRSLCLGQFVETISCAIQGKPLMTETGMSIFEHSLAFAEAEAMISSRLGFSWLGSFKPSASKTSSNGDATITKLFTRGEILDKMNTTPEVLLMGAISALNNLSSQLLGVLGMQARYRLINTGFWGLCFMSAFVWGFFSFRPESGPEAIIMRFPTVCIVGFIPHLLILFGIIICASIYSLALVICFLSPPTEGPPPRSLSDRFKMARENMQANAQLSSIRLDMQEDFYSALLKIGFSALTVASEAVYLNEGQRISVARLTWLEEERMKEVETFASSNDPSRRLGVHLERPKLGEVSEVGQSRVWKSGYDRQTSVRAVRGPRVPDSRTGTDGVGHMQRGGRYLVAGQFFRGIFWLWVNWTRVTTNKLLDIAGIRQRPKWLQRPKREEGLQSGPNDKVQTPPDSLDFWILSDEGVLESPKNDDVDVAYEMRKRQQSESEQWGEREEQNLDSSTYEWWKNGGWWGEKDESGSYQASVTDDDTTSITSISTAASETDNEDSMDIDSGASTPTQRKPFSYRSRSLSLTPSIDHADNAIDPNHLARLLDPKDKDTRNEARMLSYHLTSNRIITRSQYRRAQSSANIKLLTSTRYRPTDSSVPVIGPLSAEEETQLLEQLILNCRSKLPNAAQSADSWREGAAGMDLGGPQCVVCQSAPRTVLAWPCRCLSLCEECRVSLAMNNFGTCVCCRQDVVGFSRLYVP